MANTFEKRYRLANPARKRRRRNVAAGFYDEDGIFHPIRASYDYSESRVSGAAAKRKRSHGKYRYAAVKRNPGRRNKGKKKLTLLQKLHFGSLRQRASAALMLKGKRRRSNGSLQKKRRYEEGGRGRGYSASSRYLDRRESERYEGRLFPPPPRGRAENKGRKRRRKNIGEIRVHRFSNPSRSKRRIRKSMVMKGRSLKFSSYQPVIIRRIKNRKRRKNSSMARVSRKRHLAGLKAARTRRRRGFRVGGRRRSNPSVRHYRRRRRSNPGVRHYRRHRVSRRRMGRRRNPSFLSGMSGQVLGVVGGATVTKFITGMLPASLNTGFVGYISTAVVAFLQGNLIGKVSRNAALGKDMVVGGVTYLVLRIVQDFFPSLGGTLGLSGMGLIAPSSFYVPQVNVRGSMSRFLVPPGVPTMVVAKTGMHGISRGAMGGGRMGLRRMGRMS